MMRTKLTGVKFAAIILLLAVTGNVLAAGYQMLPEAYIANESAAISLNQDALKATPLSSTLRMKKNDGSLSGGVYWDFDAYTIRDYNYLKLRDLACMLDRTPKYFSIDWDGKSNVIALTSGKSYQRIGGELIGKGKEVKQTSSSTAKIMLDGVELDVNGYNIDGNNYYRLRDIAQAMSFYISWDPELGIIVDPYSEYALE
ncbi:MAG: hypothetical protein LBU32_15110 [Clostridiales bacterium]|jgi:hypothetical protein|nr:hypothetical protein [Clostridiales bacterium]